MVSLGECFIYTKGKKINIFCCCCVGGSINVRESNWFILLLKSQTSILIFCLVVLSVIESGVLKSAISIVKLTISHLEYANFYFIFFAGVSFSHIHFCWLCLLHNQQFWHHICLSWGLIIIFDLKSIDLITTVSILFCYFYRFPPHTHTPQIFHCVFVFLNLKCLLQAVNS